MASMSYMDTYNLSKPDDDGLEEAMSQIDTTSLNTDSEKIEMDVDDLDVDDMDVITCQIDEEIKNVGLGIPLELLEQYQKALNDILPDRSGKRYLQAYDTFLKWQSSHNTISFDEKVIMSYFFEKAQKYRPTTLWSIYSMLKKTLIVKQKVDISRYAQLIAFLKKKIDGYKPKKANVFSPKEIEKFITEAPNVRYLAMKVVTIFGVIGGCRGDEITKLTTQMVTDKDNELVIKIPDTKTKEPKLYQIDGEFAEIVRRYIRMRPSNASSSRFFLQYRNGRCVNQVMGKNYIAQIPKDIAKYLGLPNFETYSGHSFRRSSLTILADAGATIETLKRHGNHKSTKVCEGYIQNSLTYKRKVGNEISSSINSPSKSATNHTNNPNISSIQQTSTMIQEQSTSFNAGSSTSTINGSTAGDVSMTLSQTLNTVGISIPDKKDNVIFHFSGNVTINMK